MGRRRADGTDGEPRLDRELRDLPPDLRWREWLLRVEAALFASGAPVPRDRLAIAVGEGVALDALIEDLRVELARRPYEVVRVGGGWMLRTRPAYGDAIRAVVAPREEAQTELGEVDLAVLAAIATQQPITRAELAQLFGREIGSDRLTRLRARGLIAHGPRSPQPGAPRSYVTTDAFLATFGLRDLDALNEDDEEAG